MMMKVQQLLRMISLLVGAVMCLLAPSANAAMVYNVSETESISFFCPLNMFCCASAGNWNGLETNGDSCFNCANGCVVGSTDISVNGGCTGSPCQITCDDACSTTDPTMPPTGAPSPGMGTSQPSGGMLTAPTTTSSTSTTTTTTTTASATSATPSKALVGSLVATLLCFLYIFG